jgi:hypothetical protein
MDTLQPVPATTSRATSRAITLFEKKLEDEKRKAAEKERREMSQAEKSEKIRLRFKSLHVTIPEVGSTVPTTSSPLSTLSKEKQKGRPWEKSELEGERSRKRVKYSADGTLTTRPEVSTSRSQSSSSPQRMPFGSGVGWASQHLSSVPSERSRSPPDTPEQGSSTRPDSGPDIVHMSDVEGGTGGTLGEMESEEEGPGPIEVARHVLTGDEDEDEGEDEVEDEDEGEDEVEDEGEGEQETMEAGKDSMPEGADAMILDSQGEEGDSKQKEMWCLVGGEMPPSDIPADPVPEPDETRQTAFVYELAKIDSLVDDLDDLHPTGENLQAALAIIHDAERRLSQMMERLSVTGDSLFFSFLFPGTHDGGQDGTRIRCRRINMIGFTEPHHSSAHRGFCCCICLKILCNFFFQITMNHISKI